MHTHYKWRKQNMKETTNDGLLPLNKKTATQIALDVIGLTNAAALLNCSLPTVSRMYNKYRACVTAYQVERLVAQCKDMGLDIDGNLLLDEMENRKRVQSVARRDGARRRYADPDALARQQAQVLRARSKVKKFQKKAS